MFILVNKNAYGDYYGPRPWHKHMLDEEFKEMGVNLETENLVEEYLSLVNSEVDENPEETQPQRRLRRRETAAWIQKLSEQDKKMLSDLRRRVVALDISSLTVGQVNLGKGLPLRAREYKVGNTL